MRFQKAIYKVYVFNDNEIKMARKPGKAVMCEEERLPIEKMARKLTSTIIRNWA